MINISVLMKSHNALLRFSVQRMENQRVVNP